MWTDPWSLVSMLEVTHQGPFEYMQAVLTSYTGESKPTKGSVESTSDNFLETRCIGLQGTHCVSGSGIGIVIATGDATVFGRIVKLAGDPKTGLTSIEKEVLRFVALIFIIMVTWIIILAAVWYVSSDSGPTMAKVSSGVVGFTRSIPTTSMCLHSSLTA